MVPQHSYILLLSNIKHHAGQPWADTLHWCPSGPLRVTSNMEPQHLAVMDDATINAPLHWKSHVI